MRSRFPRLFTRTPYLHHSSDVSEETYATLRPAYNCRLDCRWGFCHGSGHFGSSPKSWLEVAWQGQVQLPRTKGIASAHLWAESSGARQFAVVELKNGRTIQVSADELDRDGKPIGLEAAKLRAQQQAQFHSFDANGDGLLVPAEVPNLGAAFTPIDRDLDGQISQAEHLRFIDWNTLITTTLGKNDAERMLRSKGVQEATQLLTAPTGFEATVLNIPRIKLVIVTQNGSVETLDAETGRTLWSNTCGDAAVPTFAAALSKAGIVVVQGDHLYVLDWETASNSSTSVCNEPPVTRSPQPTIWPSFPIFLAELNRTQLAKANTFSDGAT